MRWISVFLVLISGVSLGQSANPTIGPVNTQSLNYWQFVGTGNWATVTAPVQYACGINGGFGQVVIPYGAMPSDGPTVGGINIFSLSGGCQGVTILDQRGTSGASCYIYANATTYLKGNCNTGASQLGSNCSTLSSPTVLCVTQSPYYASGWVETTSATTTATAAATSITLSASCSAMGFDSVSAAFQYGHQGISIAGAGAAGDFYVGTVTTCVGSTAVITPATSTSVTTAAIHHDETTAVQSAITAAASIPGAVIYAPTGYYRFDGPLQDTSHANAILKMPNVVYGLASPPQTTPVKIELLGVNGATLGCVTGCTVFQTDRSSGNLIGGYYAAGLFPFTYISLDIENIALRTYQQSGVVLVNAISISSLQIHNSTCDVGDLSSAFNTLPIPTNTAQACLIMPGAQNNVENIVDNLSFLNTYTGISFGEHSFVTAAYGESSYNAFVMNTTSGSNGVVAGYLWAQSSVHTLVGAGQTQINIARLDSEAIAGSGDADIYDPSNNLYGDVHLGNLPSPCTAVINGATNLNTYQSQCKTVKLAGLTTGIVGNTSGTLATITALPNGTTATTQSAADNTTKIATDQFVNSTLAVNRTVGISFTSVASGLTTPTVVSGNTATSQGGMITFSSTTFTTGTAFNIVFNSATATAPTGCSISDQLATAAITGFGVQTGTLSTTGFAVFANQTLSAIGTIFLYYHCDY